MHGNVLKSALLFCVSVSSSWFLILVPNFREQLPRDKDPNFIANRLISGISIASNNEVGGAATDKASWLFFKVLCFRRAYADLIRTSLLASRCSEPPF
jgi:hypothetical protein